MAVWPSIESVVGASWQRYRLGYLGGAQSSESSLAVFCAVPLMNRPRLVGFVATTVRGRELSQAGGAGNHCPIDGWQSMH